MLYHTSNRGEKDTVRSSHSVALRLYMMEDTLDMIMTHVVHGILGN